MFSPCFRPRRQPRSLLLWKWTAPVLLRFHQRRLRWSDLAMRCRSCMVTSKKIEKCFQDVSSMIFTSYFPLVQVSNFSSSVGYYNLSWCSWNFPVMFTDNFWETENCYNWIQHLYVCTRTHTHTQIIIYLYVAICLHIILIQSNNCHIYIHGYYYYCTSYTTYTVCVSIWAHFEQYVPCHSF